MHGVFYLRTGNHVVTAQQAFCATTLYLLAQTEPDG